MNRKRYLSGLGSVPMLLALVNCSTPTSDGSADALSADAVGTDAAATFDTARSEDGPDLAPDSASPADAEQLDAPRDSAPTSPDGAPTPPDSALPPADCDLVVELSMQPTPVTTKTPIAAGSKPKICWVVPASATVLPGPGGWDLQIFRDDVSGGGPDAAEWTIIRGVPPGQTTILYGDCPPQAMGCFPAKTLKAGGHSLALWDGTRVGGLAGMVKFSVQ